MRCAVLFMTLLVGTADAQTTKPAPTYEELVAENARLRHEVSMLRAQVAKLSQRQQSVAKTPATSPAKLIDLAKPSSTFASRFKRYGSVDKRNERKWLADGEKIDRDIAEYAAKNGTPVEIVKAMYEGRPTVGMPEEALKIIATLSRDAEGVGYQRYRVRMHGLGQREVVVNGRAYPADDGLGFFVTIEGGIVTEVIDL